MKIYSSGKKILINKIRPLLNNITQDGVAMDLGCGSGDIIRCLASDYPRLKFIGADIDQLSLNYAKQYKQKNVSYIKNKAENTPLRSKSVDLIYSTEVIEHVKRDLFFIKEVYRILKNNSHFILTTPNKDVVPLKGANPDHKRHYNLTEISKLLFLGGFKIICIDYCLPDLSRRIDNILSGLKDRFLSTKTLQPCLTVINYDQRNDWKIKTLFFFFDNIIDPILTLFFLIDYQLNASKSKHNLIITAIK